MRKVWRYKPSRGHGFYLDVHDDGWPWESARIYFEDEEQFGKFVKDVQELRNETDTGGSA